MALTIDVPEPLAGRLAAEAARRGVDPAELAVETLAGALGADPGPGNALEAFIGSVDSGDPDWASTDTKVLRVQADARRPA